MKKPPDEVVKSLSDLEASVAILRKQLFDEGAAAHNIEQISDIVEFRARWLKGTIKAFINETKR